jgi:TldD protein
MVESYVQEAVSAALINLEARPAPAGEMTVVLGNGWPGVLLHEAVGHGLEGDFNRKGSSAFSGRIGQRVAAKGRHGARRRHHGRPPWFAERGRRRPRQPKECVDRRRHFARLHPGFDERPFDGGQAHGQRPTRKLRPRAHAAHDQHLHVGRRQEPEEIVASIKKGLYATNFAGGQVDITSGKFVFSASQAYWVENGKIQYPVKGATLIGSGPESLKKISMIGNDMKLDSGVGTCGKEGQSVPVGVGQPTLAH